MRTQPLIAFVCSLNIVIWNSLEIVICNLGFIDFVARAFLRSYTVRAQFKGNHISPALQSLPPPPPAPHHRSHHRQNSSQNAARRPVSRFSSTYQIKYLDRRPSSKTATSGSTTSPASPGPRSASVSMKHHGPRRRTSAWISNWTRQEKSCPVRPSFQPHPRRFPLRSCPSGHRAPGRPDPVQHQGNQFTGIHGSRPAEPVVQNHRRCGARHGLFGRHQRTTHRR